MPEYTDEREVEGRIFHGKEVARAWTDSARARVASLSAKRKNVRVTLVVVVVDGLADAARLARVKQAAAEAVGMRCEVRTLRKESGEEEVIGVIRELNEDERVHGLVVQLPLPHRVREDRVAAEISRRKDAEGASSEGGGASPLTLRDQSFEADPPRHCTPAVCLEVLTSNPKPQTPNPKP